MTGLLSGAEPFMPATRGSRRSTELNARSERLFVTFHIFCVNDPMDPGTRDSLG